jgi:SAM-dependent methyltransferase
LQPFPELPDLKLAYDIDYHGYAEGEKRGVLFSILYAAREAMFRRKMSRLVDSDTRVLDVGCGQGDFLRDLQGLGVRHLVGIDFNPGVVARLGEYGIQGFAGTFAEYESPADSFGVVSMNNYLEHTLDPPAELSRAYELLVPGGHLVGEVPGFDSFERRLFGRYWGGNHVPRHTYQFAAAFLRRQLANAGYENIRISHQLNTSHWALSVQNFMQRKVADLRHNPRIKKGRSAFYVPLLLMFIPINLFCVLLRKSGCVQFQASKPGSLAGQSHD